MDKSLHTRNAAGKIILSTCLLSLGYAILRYHILGPTPWKDLSLFTLNKGIALSAFIILIFNFSFGPLNNLGVHVPQSFMDARKTLGMTGLLLALIHVLMSFVLFNPAIYPKFFLQDGTLTLSAGFSMLGGVLSFVILWSYNLSFQTFLREDKLFIRLITSRNFLLAAMLSILLHLFFMGYQGWIAPAKWHGGLPPISLIAFIFFMIGYTINLMGRKQVMDNQS
jgi:hypothetical protein